MDLGLAGKVTLVTAARRGLGRAIATEFAREGARIALSSRSEDELTTVAREIAKSTGSEVVAIAADATRVEDVERLVRDTERRLGPIEILINNSAGPPSGAFERTDDDAWRAAFDVKLLAQIRHARAVFPGMVQRRRGRIVNIVGTHGLFAHAYAMTAGVVNAALLNLTKALAEEGAPANVLVNALNPGPIETERMRYLTEVKSKQLNVSYADARALLTSETLLKRFGQPEEIAAAAAFLASDRASFITGAILNVDGGQVRVM